MFNVCHHSHYKNNNIPNCWYNQINKSTTSCSTYVILMMIQTYLRTWRCKNYSFDKCRYDKNTKAYVTNDGLTLTKHDNLPKRWRRWRSYANENVKIYLKRLRCHSVKKWLYVCEDIWQYDVPERDKFNFLFLPVFSSFLTVYVSDPTTLSSQVFLVTGSEGYFLKRSRIKANQGL